jgi:hypothetical protein
MAAILEKESGVESPHSKEYAASMHDRYRLNSAEVC